MRVFSARSFWLPVLVATLVAAIFGAVLGRRGRVLRHMLLDERIQQIRLAGLRKENEQAKAERDALLSSPEAIERVAREDYGQSAPGETVEEYRPRPSRPTSPPASLDGLTPWQKVLVWPHLAVAIPAGVFVLTALGVACANAARERDAQRDAQRDGRWEDADAFDEDFDDDDDGPVA